MPTLPVLEAEYEEDSPWKPPDPNAVARFSLDYQRTWELRHDNEGRHNDALIPMEAATVDSAGTILQGSAGIAVTKVPATTGRYEIDLSASPMLVANEWFAHVYPDPVSSDVCWGFESVQAGAATKDVDVVEVRFVDDGGNYRDVGFWVGCFGVRG